MSLWDLLEAARPLLEIGILSFGIYWIFMLARRMQGELIVLGFLALLGFWAFSIWLNLAVLQRVLQYMFLFLPFAVLILFRREVLREVRRVAAAPDTKQAEADPRPSRRQQQNLEIIVQAADRLSDAKIGALIAIRQTVDLGQILVDSGVVVNCAVTAEMLETIFFPNNAIHDGGVVIRGDQIVRAACIFPLTRRQDLNPSLGTRHRAALGLSEESDAVVVAVSEETGMISYAHRGQLIRGISADELRSFLTSILFGLASASNPSSAAGRRPVESSESQSPPKQDSRGMFSRTKSWIRARLSSFFHWVGVRVPSAEGGRRLAVGWKSVSVFSVLTAVFLWTAMSPLSGDQPEIREYDVPILLLQKPSELRQWIVEPSAARIKVKGSPALLELLEKTDFADILVFANLMEIPSTNSFGVELEWHAPENLEVEILDPPQAEAKVRVGRE